MIVTADYQEFLDSMYAANPGLAELSYDEQLRVRHRSLFGVADFYSSNLRALDHDAFDVYFNNAHLQRAWAKEHGVRLRSLNTSLRPRRHDRDWLHKVLAAQIEHHRPDVLLNQDIDLLDATFLKRVRPNVGLLVGQHAAPLPAQATWRAYDLMLSSLPNQLDLFRADGIPAELHRLGFDPRVLPQISQAETPVPISFVGSISETHQGRTRFLAKLSERLDVTFAGPIGKLPTGVAFHGNHVGQAWGLDMYQLLAHSKITLNYHGEWAGPHANNQRLFEATGVGRLLVTDWKEDLHKLFEPGVEVAAFTTIDECVELIAYYLGHAAERETLARAGQTRTLRDHTYQSRMQELEAILLRHLQAPRRSSSA